MSVVVKSLIAEAFSIVYSTFETQEMEETPHSQELITQMYTYLALFLHLTTFIQWHANSSDARTPEQVINNYSFLMLCSLFVAQEGLPWMIY